MRLSKQREEDLTAPLESPLSPELLECTLNGNLEELKVNEEGTLRYNLPPALDLVNFSNIFTWDEERFEAFITEAEVEDTSSPSTSSLHCFTHEELPSNVMAEENKLSDYIQGGNDNSMATILVDAGVSLHSRGAIADLTISHKEEVHELLIENSADYHENCGRLYKENRRKAKNPVYTHCPDSILVDCSFILYEIEKPNNPEYVPPQQMNTSTWDEIPDHF